MKNTNIKINQQGILGFSGKSVTDLAEKYGTPLYVMDEMMIRNRLNTFNKAMKEAFDEKAEVLYASKACDFLAMYRLIQEENCGVDVVSDGEIFTAFKAGFPMKKAYFHGNNKTDSEIRFAIEKGVGTFVVDGEDELEALNQIASQYKIVQKILIRVTPGIDPHTYEAVSTGIVDCKFGSAIFTGAAEALTQKALTMEHISLQGFHCHVGSQVFDGEVFMKCADVMFRFIKDISEKLNYECLQLNLGGGYGVPYTAEDPCLNIEEILMRVGAHVKRLCRLYDIKLPQILMEPGRSIVADAGITLYRVGSVKKIPGAKNYISVDGGMSDNPRYALYRSKYTMLCANRMNEAASLRCSVVGKCCESGDILQENVLLPDTVQRNDIIAVLCTGAYNYSMASNYNRIVRPAVVMISGQDENIVVQREKLEDLIKNEL